MKPKVSVIIPTYNYAKYMRKAIDSVLNQTCFNIEIIVVDDGSTDDTASIVQDYGEKVRYCYQVNQGASAARNRGLQEAIGEYICFLDADDCYRKNNIAEKVKFLEDNRQYDWCYSDWAWVDEHGAEKMFGHEPSISLAHIKGQGDILSFALQGYRLGTNVFMFRKSLVDQLGGFDECLKVLEDYDYYVRAAALAKLGFVDKVLCDIFEHTGSLGTNPDKSMAYISRWRVHRKVERLFFQKVQEVKTKKAWQAQQADLYRNLAMIMADKHAFCRAKVLLCHSLTYQYWQPGGWFLWLKLLLK